jgi:hypothetical protein
MNLEAMTYFLFLYNYSAYIVFICLGLACCFYRTILLLLPILAVRYLGLSCPLHLTINYEDKLY